MKYKYKKRKIEDFKLITSKDMKIDSTEQLLKKEYPYILQSMKNENYKIEYDEFHILQEIIYEEKVVGIISFIRLDSFDNSLCINEAYILPEYRNKGLFHQTLQNLLSQPNMTLSLRNPNKKMIDLLIEYELAKKLDNNIVISYVNFQLDYSNRYVNDNIREYYELFEKEHQDELIRSNFYDLNINSSLFFDLDNLIMFNDNPLFIETARLTDRKDRKYFLKLKNLDLLYLDVLLERLLSIENEFELLFKRIESKINAYLNVEDILGSENELTLHFENILMKNNLKLEDGFVIRQKIIDALRKGEIIPKSIILRTMYLIEHFNEEKVFLDKKAMLGNDFEEKCPYCSTLNNNVLEVCRQCGYNIQKNNPFMEKLPEIIGEQVFCECLNPEVRLKYEIDYKENKLEDIVLEDLSYLDADEDDIFRKQRDIAVYQLLKQIEERVYFEIFDYDALNGIRSGSCFTYAIREKLITPLNNYRVYFEILEMFFSIDRLKDILEKNGHNIDGSREDLIYNIESNLSPIDIFGEKYVLTDKGKNFLRKRGEYEYFNHLKLFYFYEFILFRQKYDGGEEDFQDSFIEHMEEIAIKNSDYYIYHKILSYHLDKLDEETCEYLMIFTMLFITDINYWLSDDTGEKGDKPLSYEVMELYPEIKDLFKNEDVLSVFNRAIDSITIDYLKENKDFILFYLIKSLNYDDIDDINREIEEYAFEENYLKELLMK